MTRAKETRQAAAKAPQTAATPPKAARGLLDWIAIVLGSCAFTGFSPVAPATVASAVIAIPLWFVYPLASWRAYAVLFVTLLVVGAWASTRLERMFGHDPSAATIDEVLGMAMTLAAVPMTPAVLVLGFVLFRIADIVKVWPGRALERLPGGWGVMADDACAGLYAWIVLRAILHFWPAPQLEWWHLLVAALVGVPLVVFRKKLLRKYGKKRSRLGDARARSETRP